MISVTGKKAFTLVEMLVVIAIIAILAALLLPVLSGGQRRAQRVWCESNLKQIGMVFHTFSNDHSGKFPMAVSTNEGGSMEYVQSGLNDGGTFYTAFRQFLPLSDELVKPGILICPSDTRVATNFPALENENLSYFVGVDSTFDKPCSILAGDRNLATNAFVTPTIVQIGEGSVLHWTVEMHRSQGNVLFADGHVDEINNPGINSTEGQLSSTETLFLPSVVSSGYQSYNESGGSGSGPSGNGSSGSGSSSQNGVAGSGNTPPANGNSGYSQAAYANNGPGMQSFASMATASQPDQMPSGSSGGNQQSYRTAPVAEVSEPASVTNGSVSNTGDGLLGGVSSNPDLAMSPWDRHITKVLQHTFEWLYLLLVILLLIYLTYKFRKWMREREERQRARQVTWE